MYLYNKNILEYANIVVTEANSWIHYTEDHSIIYWNNRHVCNDPRSGHSGHDQKAFLQRPLLDDQGQAFARPISSALTVLSRSVVVEL